MDRLTQDMPVLGRIDLAREPDFALGPLNVRPARREVTGGGARRVLQRRVMQVLVALARSPNEVVSQPELISRCWDGLTVSDDAIGRCIGQLRRLASNWPEPPFAIETIPGVGYQINPRALDRKPAIQVAARRTRAGWSVVGIGATAALIAAIAGIAWVIVGRQVGRGERVAVMPFQTPPGDGQALAFAHGLADEIVGASSSNHQQAISTTESVALVGAGREAAEQSLGVGLLVDGTVERDGPQLRAQVHVDDPTQHLTLWSKTFEGPAEQPATLQAEIAARTSDVLSWALEARRTGAGLLDAPAMASLLQASDTMANPTDPRDWSSEKEVSTIALRDVTRRAPTWGIGHARLALELADAPGKSGEVRSEARRALALDPHAAEAYMALSEIEPPTHWAVRDHLLARAIEADPSFSFAILFRSRIFEGAGRTRDALGLAQRAVALRPLFPGGESTLGDLLTQAGELPEGRRTLTNGAALWPANVRLKFERLWVAVGLDDIDAALRLIDDPQTRPPSMNARQLAIWRGALTARRSRSASAIRTAARVVRRSAETGTMGPVDAFGLCSLLGNLDCAFAEADHLGADPNQTDLLFFDFARPLRRDPRFVALAARLGLVDFWRSTNHWPDVCNATQPEPECAALRVAAQAPKA